MKVRIKFAKRGVMKFIGHLDVMRFFQKAFRRAEVDIAYTAGYSPHQILSFAAPLGVGLTSEGEYLDIEVHSTESSAIMVERLNRAMADGMEVLSFKKLADDSKNAMSIVAVADYRLAFREGYEPENMEEFQQELEEFYGQESIVVLKTSKKSQREVDLKPLIYEMRMEGDTVFMKVATGSADNVKPELVMETLYHRMGKEYSPFTFQITRLEVYTGDLIPLEELGEIIE